MNLIQTLTKALVAPLLAVFVLSSSAQSQPVVWSKTQQLLSNAKVARDNAGNLYYLTSRPTSTGRRVTLDKHSSSGTLIYSRSRDETANLDEQILLKDLVVTTSKVFMLYQVRNGGGTGSTVLSSWIYRYDPETGIFEAGIGAIGTSEIWGIAANDSQLAYLIKNTSNNTYNLTFYDTTQSGPLTFLNSFDLGPSEPRGEIRMDATNTVVGALYKADTGHTRFIKASAITGISLQHEFDYANRTSEKPVRLEWDATAQRAYALVDSVFSANDTDPLLFIWNTDTGAPVHSSTVRSTVGFDFPGDLAVIPGNGIYATAFNPVTDQRTAVRRDVNGTANWIQTFALSSTDATVLRNAVDSAGNLIVSSESTNPSYSIERYGSSAGSLISRFFVPLTAANPKQMLLDAAGNMYVNVDNPAGAHLQKVQPAKLTFSANNVTGGAAVNATIQLASPATSDQVWTVTSGNTALVTAPATVTVASGASSVVVPLTIKGATSATNVSLNVRFAGYIDQQTLTVVPSVPQSVSATPQVVTGGTAIAGAVQLTGAAKTGGQTVTLTSNKPLVASVPASVNVAEGANSANFAITTYGVNANQGVVITASSGAVQKTVFIAVNAPALTSISVNPTTIKGGVTGILTLNVSGPAPTGGFAIALISGAPGLVMLPAQSSVNAGQTTRNLSMPTAAVTSSTNVLIFATRSGIYKTATLTVTP